MLTLILRLGVLLLLFPGLCLAQSRYLVIDTNTTWNGSVELQKSVQIEVPGVLTIAAGTRVVMTDPQLTFSVQGVLHINGTEEKPVLFVTPEGWKGISFVEAAKGSVIRSARFSRCAQALGIIATSPLIVDTHFERCETAIKLLRESSAEIRHNRFIDNGLGVGIEMRSSPLVVNNYFSGQTKSGISASNSSRGRIEGNQFEDNEQGIGILQKYPDLIKKNKFIGNRVGLYC